MKSFFIIAVLSVVVFSFLPLNTNAVTQSTEPIQVEIDQASPDDVIYIPAGEYVGKIVLKNGVSLVGSDDGETIIDGSDADIAIEGASDSILSNLTIISGRVAVDTGGAFMGIFDCTFLGHGSAAIHVCGGSAVIVNNIIEGGSISCNSSNPLIICNTIVTADTDGLWSWYGPGPTAVNNLIVCAKCAVHAGAGSIPSLDNNAFWANESIFAGCEPDINPIYADPLFLDPEGGDYRLSPSSPLIGAGRIIEGFWEDERPDVGWNEGKRCAIEECRAFMELVAPDLIPDTSVVVYTLGHTTGEFLVTTKHPVNRFTVCSSTPNTPITDIEAFDEEDEVTLTADLIEDEYPRVKVESGEPILAPAEPLEDRYILNNIYHSPESYYDDDMGLRIFRRKTNFPRVIIEIPDGYNATRASKNGIPIEGDLSDVIEISSPGIKEIEVVLEKKSIPDAHIR